MSIRESLADSDNVAEYLNTSRRNLDQMASRGDGPPYVIVGRERRYRWSDVDKWVAERMLTKAGERAPRGRRRPSHKRVSETPVADLGGAA